MRRCMAVIMWEDGGPDKEVDQRQARWLHALSCLIVLTGNKRKNSSDLLCRGLGGLLAWWKGGMIKMAPGLFWLNADRSAGDLSLVSMVEGTFRFVHDSLG